MVCFLNGVHSTGSLICSMNTCIESECALDRFSVFITKIYLVSIIELYLIDHLPKSFIFCFIFFVKFLSDEACCS